MVLTLVVPQFITTLTGMVTISAVPVCDTVPSTAIATLREVVKATVEDISYTNLQST